MFTRSSALKRSITRLLRSMNSCSMSLFGPGVARVVLVRQPALGEVDRDAHGAGVEALRGCPSRPRRTGRRGTGRASSPAISLLERVEQHQHRRRDHGLLDRVRRDRAVLLDELRRERLVAERAAGQPRQLAVVAVVEDREELAVAGEVVGQAGAGQRVRDRVGREARLALLAVGDDRLADLLQPPDRVLGRGVLLRLQLGPARSSPGRRPRRPPAASSAAAANRPARWEWPCALLPRGGETDLSLSRTVQLSAGARRAAARPAPARAPAACTSPSAAATIEPFMRMCHWRANASGSATPASRRQPGQELADVRSGAGRSPRAPGPRGRSSSSITLMNEQPSKSARANHSPKTSKIASSRAARRRPPGARPRPAASRASSAPRARPRNATISSSLEAKLRYSVIFAAPASAMMRSTPTARVPWRLNSS